MKKIYVIFLLLLRMTGYAQPGDGFFYELDQSIPLSEGEKLYDAPWSGGLNAAQYNTLDLNFDGKEDLVLFDRMAQKVITFVQTENDYKLSPDYESLFPPKVYNWLLLRDFNCDGKKDIFTGHIFGISVYKNVTEGDQLKWELFPFYEGNSVSEVILTQGLSGRINLQLQFDDLPSITDADGDGDLDIFAMNYGGAGVIEFHKNLSQENNGNCESLDFELADNWWGGVTECECGKFVFNRKDCSTLPGRVDHAGGKSLLLFDGNGDGVQDMLISEGECNELYFLPNTGTLDAPVLTEALPFPFGSDPGFSIYPTGYFEDVDFDGIKDLMVSPNIYSKSSPAINLSQSNWFYKNTGTNADPQLTFQTASFLQSSMFDVGDNAVPALADVDADGDEDLFVSSNRFPSAVMLYENVGSPFEPNFRLYSEDFLYFSLSSFSNIRLKIVDIDNDGKKDFVFTGTDLYSGVTGVYFIRNKGDGQMDFSNQEVERLQFQLSGPENASFVDVNGDGKMDILKGKSNGSVEWWEQESQQLQFSLKNAQFLQMGANVYSNNASFSEADLNADGKPDLILSDQSGKLKILSDYRSASDMSSAFSEVVFNTLTTSFQAPNLGGRTWVTTGKLYGNKFPVIMAGTGLGGVRVLRNQSDESSEPVINLYPNPVSPASQTLKVSVNKMAMLKIYSVNGQQTRPDISIPAKEIQDLPLYDYAAGMYILQFTVDNKMYIRRLVVY